MWCRPVDNCSVVRLLREDNFKGNARLSVIEFLTFNDIVLEVTHWSLANACRLIVVFMYTNEHVTDLMMSAGRFHRRLFVCV